MHKIKFIIHRAHVMAASDSAYILADDDPREALVEAAIQGISTDVEITAGGVTLHLAAWMDPEHWSEEWSMALGEVEPDVDAFIEGLIIND